MNSHNNLQFTTVGQKLIKEPIWIGMIVVFNLLILFGISYVVKKKCAKYLMCCKDTKAILREREDEIPAHCNAPVSASYAPGNHASIEVISECTSPVPADDVVLEYSDYFPRSSLPTPRVLTPTVDMANKEAAAILFASYDKHLTFPFDAHNCNNDYDSGGLMSGVLEFNPSEKDDKSEDHLVIQSPPLRYEYGRLRCCQTTSNLETKSGHQTEDFITHIMRSKSLPPAGISKEGHQYPNIVILNECMNGAGESNAKNQSLAVPSQERCGKSSFKSMNAEDKRRVFSEIKPSYKEKSLLPITSVQRSKSNREVLLLSQSDNTSSDTGNITSLDSNTSHYQLTIGAPKTARKFCSDTKVCERRSQSCDSSISASFIESRRNKHECRRKYVRIVKKNCSRHRGHAHSRDTSVGCSCGPGDSKDKADCRKRRPKKKTKRRVLFSDSSSDKEDFNLHPLRWTKKNDRVIRSQEQLKIDGQIKSNCDKDKLQFEFTPDSCTSHSKHSDHSSDVKHTKMLYNNKTASLSSSNPSEEDDQSIKDTMSFSAQLSDRDTGFSSSSKSFYSSSWKESGPICMYKGTEVKTKPKYFQLPKQRIQSTNSVNSCKVKDSAYQTIQSSLDIMSFDKPNEKPKESLSKRNEDQKIINQLEQVSFKLSMFRNMNEYTQARGHSKDSAFSNMSDEDLTSWDSDCSGRRASYPGIINKAFTLEQVSEEGDVTNTPEQHSFSEQPETASVVCSAAPRKATPPLIKEEIEMVEF